VLIPLLARAAAQQMGGSEGGEGASHKEKKERNQSRKDKKRSRIHSDASDAPKSEGGEASAEQNETDRADEVCVTESTLRLAVAINELAFVVWRIHGQLLGQDVPTLHRTQLPFDLTTAATVGGASVLRVVFSLELQRLCLGAAVVREASSRNELIGSGIKSAAAGAPDAKRRRIVSVDDASQPALEDGEDEPLDSIVASLLQMVSPLLVQPERYPLTVRSASNNTCSIASGTPGFAVHTLATELWRDLLDQTSLIDAVCSPKSRNELARHGARFPTEGYTRGCHWITRMFA
jgi:hypothetical protein